MSELRLIELNCRQCAGDLRGRAGDAVFVCPECHLGYEPLGGKLRAHRISYAAPPAPGPGETAPPVTIGLPIWRLDCHVTVEYPERSVEDRLKSVLSNSMDEVFDVAGLRQAVEERLKTMKSIFDGEAKEKDLAVFVPGFKTTQLVQYTAPMGLLLTSSSVEFPPGPPLEHPSIVYGLEDAGKLAELTLTALETTQDAGLLHVGVELEVRRSNLFVIPFVEDGEFLVEQRSGARILRKGLPRFADEG